MFYITGDTHGNFSRIEHFCEEVLRASRTETGASGEGASVVASTLSSEAASSAAVSTVAPASPASPASPTSSAPLVTAPPHTSQAVDDVMIILGDAGLNFYGGFRDRYKKERLSRLPLTIFSIHGNHEMRPGTIASYHLMDWRGGKVYVEDDFPNLLFAVDGEIYDFDGIQTIVIGGAYSVDKFYRLANNYGWWPDEQPSPAIKEKVERVLADRCWAVDVVLSHTTPLKYEPVEVFLPSIDQSKVDKSTETWLDGIEDRLTYKHWYCGHYHVDKDVDCLSIMFQAIREFGAPEV